MHSGYHDLLSTEIVNSIKGLELISRVVVDSYLAGLNRSSKVGMGQEFSQYRSYEPGDDLRLLDWKMLARSSRYYIKQSEIETNISVQFILDTSRSMLHKEEKLTKLDYARVLVAAIGYLAHSQGDALGLFTINDERVHTLYPKVEKRHFNRFLNHLVDADAQGRWPQVPGLEHLHNRRRKSMTIFVSDMYAHDNELFEFVKGQKNPRNEVMVIHLAGANELQLNYPAAVSLEDLETGKRIKLNTKEVRSQYIRSITDYHTHLSQLMLEHGIGYHLFNMSEPMGEVLGTFLKRRKKLL